MGFCRLGKSMSEINYEKIRRQNIEEYGKATHHLAYFADIYSTRTHFIFEILQNAEDALARRLSFDGQGYVRFELYRDRLEIYHNGKPFDEGDIVGICGIGEGTKVGDYTQIGKFGIGFKSVYAYSFFPQIHSESEHFEISRFVEPYEIESRKIQDTLIVLPFDRPNSRPEWAFREDVSANNAESEISRAIKMLNIRTLLFLRQIEKIEWILPNGVKGFLTKQTMLQNLGNDARRLKVLDHEGIQEQWQVFACTITVKDGKKEQKATVEVAYLLDENGKVTRASNTELIISFPTEKKTELGFLIQAPFKATKSRDNIKSDDPANHQMLQSAATLAAESLALLRDSGCLAVNSFNALPLDKDDFSEENFFRPVYEKIREALKTQPILPAFNGSFISADQAKLARGKELIELFAPEQLGDLFEKQQLVWLDSSITSDKFLKFHSYLLDLVDGIQIIPESLAPKLTADFLKVQTISWLIKFIQYVEDGAKALKRTSFIRLQSGNHVPLPDKQTEPTAWFAPAKTEGLDLSAFPLVHRDLAANETVRAFLEKEGIHEIDAADLVIESILPKYTGDLEFNYSDYLYDLEKIANAYTGSDEAKQKLEDKLDSIEWLACVQAGNECSDAIIWKQPKERDLFSRPEELEITFSELNSSKIHFLHPLFEKEFEKKSSFNDYLSKKCVNELNAVAIVEQIILPKYKPGNGLFNEHEYRKDLLWLLKAPQAKDLKKIPWLACVHASGNNQEEIIWKRPNASESDKSSPWYDSEFEKWRKESTIYIRDRDFETWFSGLNNIDACFLHASVESIFESEQLNRLVKPIDKLEFLNDSIFSKGFFELQQGFNPYKTIVGLQEGLDNWSTEKFKVLWRVLLQNPKIISGEIKRARYKYQLNAAKKEIEYTEVGKLCRESLCIPDIQGNFHKPRELFLCDLPSELDTESVYAKDVAERLGMKKPEFEKAVDELSKGDPRKKALLDFVANATPDELEKFEKLKPQIVPPQPAPSFKNGLEQLTRPQHGKINPLESSTPIHSIGNPDRYQSKINTETEERIRQHERTPQTISFSVVRETSSNHSARHFLYEQYQGKCQITGFTFPKASANADGDAVNYFEACALLSYSNADYLNNEGNMLSVSADTMAKFKHASFEWIDDLEATIEAFTKRTAGKIEDVKVKIRLAGEESEITWRERHFARLVALYQADNSTGENT